MLSRCHLCFEASFMHISCALNEGKKVSGASILSGVLTPALKPAGAQTSASCTGNVMPLYSLARLFLPSDCSILQATRTEVPALSLGREC